jgi:hypothetical protein
MYLGLLRQFKFTVLSLEGTLFSCNFDLNQQRRYQPIYKVANLKITDFCYLDHDGVFAAVSYSNKELIILYR